MRFRPDRHIPISAIVRWWYVLAILPLVSYVFGVLTNLNLFPPIRLWVRAMEESPRTSVLLIHPAWKEDLLFALVGFVMAGGLVWLLEEVRSQ